MVSVQEPTTNGSMRDRVIACQIMFGARVYVARHLLDKLHRDDVVLAYRQTIEEYTLDKFSSSMETSRYHRKDLARLGAVFSILYGYVGVREARRIEKVEIMTSRKSAKSRTDTGSFFMGDLPPRALRFGEYLYYKGLISREQLAAAVQWQKHNRPLFGQIAMQKGMLSSRDFGRVLIRVRQGAPFGEVARSMGLLTREQIGEVIEQQRNHECPIGKYFVQQCMLTQAQVDHHAAEMARHNGVG